MPSNVHLLIIDDNHQYYTAFREQHSTAYVFDYAGHYERGLDLIKRETYDAVLLDLKFPPKDAEYGLNHILPQAIKFSRNRFPILIVSHSDRPDTIDKAMNGGATLFLAKSEYSAEKWDMEIRRAIRKFKDPATRLPDSKGYGGFITSSPAMEAVKEELLKFVNYPHVPVLVRGETGVGKEAAIRFLHAAKKNSKLPLKIVNLAALNKETIFSELFGHVKGSFTGAIGDKIGYFESAQNGTLLLDEIGEISLELQASLLTILGNRTFQRMGSTEDVRLEAQLIFATHADLEEAVRQGRMREDFLARFDNNIVFIPPLWERREEIAPLIEHFLPHTFSHTTHPLYGKPPLECFTKEALQILVNYDWPSNIRQLQSVLQRLVIDADIRGRDLIDIDMIPQKFKFPGRLQQRETGHNYPDDQLRPPQMNNWVPKKIATYLELQQIEQALNKSGWRKNDAAQMLGLKNEQNIRSRVLACRDKFPELLDYFLALKMSYKI